MPIKEYIAPNGETLYRVTIHLRGSKDPSARVQRQTDKIKSREDAEKEESKLLREAERELGRRENQGINWYQLLEAYNRALVSLEQKGESSLHQQTRHDYFAALYKWTKEWLKRPANQITNLDVRQVIETLRAEGRTNAYQIKVKGLINKVFTYGLEARLIKGIDNSPVFGIKIKKKGEKVPDILTAAQIQKLLSLAKQYEPKWFFVWAMAVFTGMRNGELYTLLWNDVDFDGRTIHVTKAYSSRGKVVKSTKSGYWRDVPISSELESVLKELKLMTGNSQYVLPRLREWERGMQATQLRKFCLQIGLPSVRFHALRACFATQLLKNGVAPVTVMKICGWQDLKTMQHYIRLSGIEIDGATEVLRFLTPEKTMEEAAKIFTLRSRED